MESTPSDDWKNTVYGPFVEKKAEREESFHTPSGLEVPACTFSDEVSNEPEGPGVYPYTRGIHPTMYRGRLWTMRQYSGFSSARATNERFRYLLEGGQTGLSVAFDLPTQIGYDSDHTLASAEAGRVGVAINSLKDFETLFEGIPIEKVSTSMTINATAIILFSMYLALAKRQNVAPEKIVGTVQNDILKEFIARGNFRFNVASSMRLTTDLFRFQQETAPRFNPVSVSGYHMREAGCTAVQEVAFTLGNGIAYLEAAKNSGLDVAATARRMSFFFNGHNDLFEEVAKFRAARRMWADIVRNQFGVEDAQAQQLRFHTQTGGSTLTSQQPLVNASRVTVQALAAVMGGTQSLHTNGFDEAISLPSEASALLALRTQQVLAHESGVGNMVDPLGGAPFVEHMTDEVEEAARVEMTRIQEEYEGMLGAVEAGYVQREIHREAVRHQREVESGDRVVVGVNAFQVEQEPEPEVFRPKSETRKSIFRDLEACREGREDAQAKLSLERLAEASTTTEPLGPFVLEAVESLATVGEICSALEKGFGPYQPPSVF